MIKVQYFRGLSLKDELTDLPNYRSLRNFITYSSKTKHLSFVLLDINNFKEFNSITIQKGDDVLREFSDVLKKMLDKDVFICRYRFGDEFAFVFQNKNISEIELTVKKLQHNLSEYEFKCLAEMKDYRLSFCYGTSVLDAGNTDADLLFKAAETELAMAKKEKKD